MEQQLERLQADLSEFPPVAVAAKLIMHRKDVLPPRPQAKGTANKGGWMGQLSSR
jgi:hypothetical protein